LVNLTNVGEIGPKSDVGVGWRAHARCAVGCREEGRKSYVSVGTEDGQLSSFVTYDSRLSREFTF